MTGVVISAPVTLSRPRLTLEPLRVEHADELAGVLSEPALYEFTGGMPPTVEELRTRYARQVVGRSANRAQLWFNWVLRERQAGAAVGTVQATVTQAGENRVAEVAWVIGAEHQRQGYAREAAAAMVTWLLAPALAVETGPAIGMEWLATRARPQPLRVNREPSGLGCAVVVAHIHPDHAGSAAVARALGLHRTGEIVDGERRWERRW